MSAGSIRRALRLFKRFIQSGNSNLYEIIEVVKNIDNAVVDYDYVFESVARGDNKYYNSQESEIKNIFTYYDDGFYSHFTVLYLLQFLDRKANFRNQSDAGYVEVEEILEKFSMIFLSRDRLVQVLEALLKQFLIDSNVGARESFLDTTSIRISELGKYYINDLIHDWKYYQHIMIDTPIRDLQVYEKLKIEVSRALKMKYRPAKMKKWAECTELFMQYLSKCEEEEIKFLKNMLSGSLQLPFESIMPKLWGDFKSTQQEQLKASRTSTR